AGVDQPGFTHARRVGRAGGPDPAAPHAFGPVFGGQVAQEVFDGGAGNAETAHFRVGFAGGIGANAEDDAAAILAHMPGREAADIEPGFQTALDRHDEAFIVEIDDRRALGVAPVYGAEDDINRAAGGNGIVQMSFDRGAVQSVDGGYMHLAAAGTQAT